MKLLATYSINKYRRAYRVHQPMFPNVSPKDVSLAVQFRSQLHSSLRASDPMRRLNRVIACRISSRWLEFDPFC